MNTPMARSVRVTASYLPREKFLLPAQSAAVATSLTDSHNVMGKSNSLDSGVYGLRDSPNSVLRDSPPANYDLLSQAAASPAGTVGVLSELQPACDVASPVRHIRQPAPPFSPQISPQHQVQCENVPCCRSETVETSVPVPEYIVDPKTRTTYLKGKFLGKGGFARVHELIDLTNNRVYAGKIIPHSRISKPHNKEKIAREINLHRSLRHRHIVRFEHCFEDADNVYIILENCPKKSLVHVLKHRHTLSESEVRYYISQVTEACQYIHAQNIVHRDLKLGNLFLADDMTVKVGDFGLATRLIDEKKPTICGTPNYIAPEVLDKEGHGFEADRWAIGCIMYAMLVGQPPFETDTLHETYRRIRANQYHLPVSSGSTCSPNGSRGMSLAAADLIRRLLDPVPSRRPSPHVLLQHEFFTAAAVTDPPHPLSHIHPPHLQQQQYSEVQSQYEPNSGVVEPVTGGAPGCGFSRPAVDAVTRCRTVKDAATTVATNGRLSNKCKERENHTPSLTPSSLRQRLSSVFRSYSTSTRPSQQTCSPTSVNGPGSPPSSSPGSDESKSSGCSSTLLYKAVADCIRAMPPDGDCNPEQVAHSPLFITKWIDYSNKYGFGFQLSDRSVGVLFNDSTKVLFVSDHSRVHFVGRHGKLCSFAPSQVPSLLQERFTLLRYFGQYMDENLTEGGDTSLCPASSSPSVSASSSSCCSVSSGPARSTTTHNCSVKPRPSTAAASLDVHMKRWVRTQSAIVMQLSNGTIQINFFKDHTKVILSTSSSGDPLVTYINSDRRPSSFLLRSVAAAGCARAVRDRLYYTCTALHQFAQMDVKCEV